MVWGGTDVIIIEIKCILNSVYLNHPKTIPQPFIQGKIVFMKPVPCARKVGDCCTRVHLGDDDQGIKKVWNCDLKGAGKDHNGQRGLACCSPRGHKGSDMTERLNWTELKGCNDWFDILIFRIADLIFWWFQGRRGLSLKGRAMNAGVKIHSESFECLWLSNHSYRLADAVWRLRYCRGIWTSNLKQK